MDDGIVAEQLSKVDGAVGTAVLRLADGEIMRTSGDLASDDTAALKKCYLVVLDASHAVRDNPMRRVTISVDKHMYVMTVVDSWLCVVKKRGTLKASVDLPVSASSLPPGGTPSDSNSAPLRAASIQPR